MASNAEQLFHEIVSATDRIAVLRAMVSTASPTFEEEWLDFKSGTDGPGPPAPPVDLSADTVKKLWSTALSGFANTGGGVLIWGIDARSMPLPSDPTKKIDAACGFRLVPHPDALRTQLMQLHHQATDPPVTGVRVEPIHDPLGGGFVVCFIPESSFRPHRAELIENRPYFLRVGDNFKNMPTSVLRSMFYPRLSPRYLVEVRCRAFNLQSPAVASIRFDISIENHGTATAREPFITIHIDPALGGGLPGNTAWQFTGTGFQYVSSIHPGARSTPLTLHREIGAVNLPTLDKISLWLAVHALDSAFQSFFVDFDFLGISNGEIVKIATQKTNI